MAFQLINYYVYVPREKFRQYEDVKALSDAISIIKLRIGYVNWDRGEGKYYASLLKELGEKYKKYEERLVRVQ